MEYLFIQKTRIGFKIYTEHDRTGLHCIGYSKKDAIAKFRRDFNCIGKHFVKIEV